MPGYLGRQAAAVSGRVLAAAKKKGQALTSNAAGYVKEKAASYDLAEKSNVFFSAIGCESLKIRKYTPDGPSGRKKRRRRHCRDGTVVVEEYRDRNAGSESEDSDSCSDTDDESCVMDEVEDSVTEGEDDSDDDSDRSEEEDWVRDEWVKLKQKRKECNDGSPIHDIEFQPTIPQPRASKYSSSFARRQDRETRVEEKGKTREDGRKKNKKRKPKTQSRAETRAMASVMFVPESAEELERSVYHSAHSFRSKQSG